MGSHRENRKAEQRIANFIAKHQTAGVQNWAARWISFKAIAQYCAGLRTPRKSQAGEQGKQFAYDELILAISRGEFSANGRSRVLLLVSHAGKMLSISANELLEAREAFEPDIFETGYLENCWSSAELVYQWFHRIGVPAPSKSGSEPLRIKRGRPLGAIDHRLDVDIIDRALMLQAETKISERAAVEAAIDQANRSEYDKTGSETDRLRTRMRRRRKLRALNKHASG